jgi:predicted lipoprotein with Yx(FWY)xxD motif
MQSTFTSPAAPRRTPIGRLAALGVAAALGLAACGGSVPINDTSAAGDQTAEATSPAAGQPSGGSITATSAASPLGDILVDDDGLTLYGFTNDLDGRSVCSGTCADAWPPVVVGPDWNVAPGLDAAIFNTITRDDGTLQLVAGKWPLYTFAGDAVPGDLNGQGSGGVWFVVDTNGALIKDAVPDGAVQAAPGDQAGDPAASEAEAAAPVTSAEVDAGTILVDQNGLSLYGFLDDTDGLPTCTGACADAWPPVLVESATLPAGLDPEVFSVVDGADGTFQLKAGVWPLYRFAGDAEAGDINGQGSGAVWFLARPDGGLIRPDQAPAGGSADDQANTDDQTDTVDY